MKEKLFFLFMIVLFGIGCISQRPTRVTAMSELSYPWQVKYVTLPSSIRIGYMDEGKGSQTIVFVHGLGSYAPAWKKNFEALKFQYRCIAIDLPGYGHSSKGDYSGHMVFYAEVIQQMLEALDIDQVILAGHSMGGQIAITTALLYPEKVSHLILIAPAGFETFHKGQKQWFREVFTPDMVRLTPIEAIRNNYATNFYQFPKDAEFMINDRIAMRDADDFDWYCDMIPKNVRGMVDYPVFDLLPGIRQPVLTIFGRNDNLIPNRYLNGGSTESVAKAGNSRIPNGTLHLVKKAGHFVHFEKSEEVNQHIVQFLVHAR